MTTLVTGATGFVGSAVVRRLLEAGESVRVLARPKGDRHNLKGLDVEIIEGDLNDVASRAKAVRGIHSLFHVAADYRLWIPDPQAMYQTNVEATTALLTQAAEAGAQSIIYTSSVAVLGIPKDGTPGTETTPVTLAEVIGHYKRSKFLADDAVRKLVTEHHLPIILVYPSTPIGPRDIKPTPTGRLVLDAAAGRIPAYIDTGLNVVHVDDCADGHLLARAKGKPGDRYILGGHDLTLREILEIVSRYIGRRAPRIKLSPSVVLPIAYASEFVARLTKREPLATVDGVRMARKYMFFSSSKAIQELGYTARPAEQALHDAVDWFRQNNRF